MFAGQISVGLQERVPFSWNFVLWKNGINGAFWFTCATIDAFIGVDEHGEVQGARLWLGFVNALHRADIDAGGVFGIDASFCNDVGHGFYGFRGARKGERTQAVPFS